jgi:hypothetical protein
MSGRRSHRTYAVRAGAERWAFIPHPEVAGWWFRAHPAVLVAVCPHCKAPIGHPCKGVDGYVIFAHYQRRQAARDGVMKLDYALGLVIELGKPKP